MNCMHQFSKTDMPKGALIQLQEPNKKILCSLYGHACNTSSHHFCFSPFGASYSLIKRAVRLQSVSSIVGKEVAPRIITTIIMINV